MLRRISIIYYCYNIITVKWDYYLNTDFQKYHQVGIFILKLKQICFGHTKTDKRVNFKNAKKYKQVLWNDNKCLLRLLYIIYLNTIV